MDWFGEGQIPREGFCGDAGKTSLYLLKQDVPVLCISCFPPLFIG
jgi:hypothetical protein